MSTENIFLNLLMVLVAAWGAGIIAVRFGLPAILGELFAGILLGPALLGVLQPSVALDVLAEVGVHLLMLYIGMEIQPRELVRASRNGLLAAIGGFIVPFAAGFFVMQWQGYGILPSLFIGMAMGVTSLATKSRVLIDLKLIGTRISSVLMTGALFADTFVLVLFAIVIGFAATGDIKIIEIFITVIKVVLFFGTAIFIGLKLFPYIGQYLERAGLTKRTTNFTFVLIVTFVFSELAHVAGLHGILGAFIAGVFLQEGIIQKKWSHEITNLVHDLSIGFLAPIFFVKAGFHVSFDVIWTHTWLLIAIITLATVGKIVGTVLFYLPSGHGWREGFVIGCGMNGRGAVEVIIAEIGLALGLIDAPVFSLLLLMAFTTTLLEPVMLSTAVKWFRKRGELVMADSGKDYIVIVGAMPIGRMMATLLGKHGRNHVVLIDQNPMRCKLARQEGFHVVCGNALDHDVLLNANLNKADMLISLIPDASTGLAIGRYAQTEFNIAHVYIPRQAIDHAAIRTEVDKHGIKTLFFKEDELEHLQFEPKQTQLQVIEQYVPDQLSIDEAMQVLDLNQKHIPLILVRNGKATPFCDYTQLEPGDLVLSVLLDGQEQKQNRKILAGQKLLAAPCLDLEATTQEELLSQLAPVLAQHVVAEPAMVLAKLKEREQEFSTIIAPGIAVPHFVIPELTEPHIVIARVKKGVKFSASQPPIYAFFAVASGSANRERYLDVLWAIATMVSQPIFLSKWVQAEHPNEFKTIIEQSLGITTDKL